MGQSRNQGLTKQGCQPLSGILQAIWSSCQLRGYPRIVFQITTEIVFPPILFESFWQLTSIDQLVVWANGFSRFRCWWVFNYGFLSATDAAGTVVSQHGSGTGWELRCGGGMGLALSKSFQHYFWILFGSIRDDDPKVGNCLGWVENTNQSS